jgi:hypothetical protein
MKLTEKKVPRILCISHGASDDYGHKVVNHIIGDAVMKAHPREIASIIRENKQFIMIGPRGHPRNSGEQTDIRPPSAIYVVTTSAEVLPDVSPTENDVKIETEAHGASFDTTVHITRIGFDNQSVSSEESDGNLDYDPVALISACQDVSIVVRNDEQLIDLINANWDEELTTTQGPGTWPTDISTKQIGYGENEWEQEGFYDAQEDTQGKDMPKNAQS